MDKFFLLSLFILFQFLQIDGGYYDNYNSGSGGYDYMPKYNENPYLPAPPGKTPPCATNGATYCEKVDKYPKETIQYLLYRYENYYSKFLKSELNKDIILLVQNETGYTNNVYGPPNRPPIRTFEREQTHKNPATSFSHFHNYLPPSDQSNFHKERQQMAAAAIVPIIHSVWWNHVDTTKNTRSYPYLPQNNYFQHRVQKRQVSTDENQLCPIFTEYITPKAAMNVNGNWMFVINMDNTNFQQAVRVEKCVSDGGECNGICNVPGRYKAKCRQKLLQRRLIALDGSGNTLLTDVFPIPSCCVCEISRA